MTHTRGTKRSAARPGRKSRNKRPSLPGEGGGKLWASTKDRRKRDDDFRPGTNSGLKNEGRGYARSKERGENCSRWVHTARGQQRSATKEKNEKGIGDGTFAEPFGRKKRRLGLRTKLGNAVNGARANNG